MALNYFSESITRRHAILYEFSAWFIYFIIYSLILSLAGIPFQNLRQLPFTLGLLALVFYTNIYLIVIPCLDRKQYIRFAVLTVLLMITYVGIRYVLLIDLLPLIGIVPLSAMLKSTLSQFTFDSLFLALHYLSLSYGYVFALRMLRLERHKRENERRILKLENNNRLTELAFLRTQLNPHFLFNTLNFFFSDALTVSPRLADGIMNLSQMLRTITEIGKDDMVSAAQEINYIRYYLNIHRYRFNEQLSVYFDVEGDEISRDFMLPPLILISLVENLFKYGDTTSPEKPAHITISINQNELNFHSKNSCKLTPVYTQSGVGLQNIRQQLELAFDDNASLSFYEVNDIFYVNLTIVNPVP